MQLLDILHNLLQTRGNGEAAAVGAAPEKEVKIGDSVFVIVAKVALAHGKLIKVTEHGHIQLVVSFHSKHLIAI